MQHSSAYKKTLTCDNPNMEAHMKEREADSATTGNSKMSFKVESAQTKDQETLRTQLPQRKSQQQ